MQSVDSTFPLYHHSYCWRTNTLQSSICAAVGNLSTSSGVSDEAEDEYSKLAGPSATGGGVESGRRAPEPSLVFRVAVVNIDCYARPKSHGSS